MLLHVILLFDFSRRYGIISPWIERIAAEYSVGTHKAALEESVNGNCLLCIFRATWSKAAAAVGKPAQCFLVYDNKSDTYFLERREITVHNFSRRFTMSTLVNSPIFPFAITT